MHSVLEDGIVSIEMRRFRGSLWIYLWSRDHCAFLQPLHLCRRRWDTDLSTSGKIILSTWS